MTARKVTLNPTLYEERECFNEKVNLIFYKLIRVELIVYLLRLCFVLLLICSLHVKDREKDSAVARRRLSLR